ncbi:hypothetical protein LWI29_036375 [Acer saccharum]|uniref:Uncharacterized protein n=1 Tax=Acer saccharum TaxID=4024 RepID=A0AA39RTY2_ACESA|nr:hypothetical protein LWI29_036375 [Acer saccharum]
MMIWAFYPALKPIQEKRHIQLHNLITLTNCRTFVCNRPSSSSSDVSKVRVAYQGIPGAYSEAAALKAYLKSETVPCEQFEAAFKGTEAVQGISLSTSKLKDVQLGFQALMKMNNLRTLIMTYGYHYNGGLDHLSNELRYLHWSNYPLEVLPSSFNPENLVELDLFYSKIKQLWEGSTRVPKLKWLKLDYCVNLISIPDLSNFPSAEIINLKNCHSLIEIHSSRECPKNLHSLNLSFCRNLSSFPSNIHLSEEPSFSTSVVLHSSREDSEFSLRYCFSLTKFPDIPRNIKRLDLRYSGVEEVRSTIQSLSKLESLDMSNCTRLKRISESICKLKSLDRLDLSGCCKLESFPDILEGMELKHLDLSGTAIKELPLSIGNLNRLEELVLSDSKLEKLPPLSGLCSLSVLKLNNCNLTEISEDIGCLSSLEMLDLQGNLNFERLPKSIKKLSKLYHLTLSNCGMLPSLPELPSIVRYLDAMKCEELIHSLPDESEFELCSDGSGSLEFNFMNCLKLNQKTVSNLLIFFQVSVQKLQLMGTEKIISLFKVSPHEVKGSLCLPGSKIPEWFCYKNLGSSIHTNIPVLRNDCGRSSYIMGFAICLVIGFEDYNFDSFKRGFDVRYDFHIETSDGHKEQFFGNSIQLSGMPVHRSNHIILGYNLSRKFYEFFQELDTRLVNRGMSDYVGTLVVFNIRSIHFVEGKYCGIQPIYVQAQVMNSVAINQDTGDINGYNDTVEETCEPHPKRTCTKANQCFTTHGL